MTDIVPYQPPPPPAAVEHDDVGDNLIEQWLTARAKSDHTRKAYRADLDHWLTWCHSHQVDPMDPRKTDVESWHRDYAEQALPTTGRRPSKASVARKVAAVASFYNFLVDEDYLDAVPVRSSTRPQAPKQSTTVGLSAHEAVRLRAQAAAEGPTTRAIIDILLVEGLRVAELADLTIGSYGWNTGRRTIVVVGKGEKRRELVVGADVAAAVDDHLQHRATQLGADVARLDPDSPMFTNAAGGRVSQQSVMRTVQRLAKTAGIPSWPKLSPHSLRHTCATQMINAGVPINIVQDQLGHADLSSTLRYDRARGTIERSGMPTYEAYLRDIATTLGVDAA